MGPQAALFRVLPIDPVFFRVPQEEEQPFQGWTKLRLTKVGQVGPNQAVSCGQISSVLTPGASAAAWDCGQRSYHPLHIHRARRE